MTLAEKIYQLRRLRGLSQEELAEQLNVSRQAISRWETGSAQPDASNLLQISRFFTVSADDLLDDAVVLPRETTFEGEEENDSHSQNSVKTSDFQIIRTPRLTLIVSLLLLGGAVYLAGRLLSLFLPYLAYLLGIKSYSTIFQLLNLIGSILLLILLLVIGILLFRKAIKAKYPSKSKNTDL